MIRLFRGSAAPPPDPAPAPAAPPRVRTPQTTVSLDWLLGLTGQLADSAPTSLRFRENIESPNIKLGELETWITQALVQPLGEQRLLALQDLVNSIGKRLGFGVTYGRYRRAADDWLPFDGLWRIEADLFATVDVYSVRLEDIDFKRLTAAAEQLQSSNKLLAKSDLLHLFVLCDDYAPELERAVRSGDQHARIRLLPVNALLEILKMFHDGVVTARQLPFLFRPYDNVGIHNVILFLEQFIAGFEPEAAQPPSSSSVKSSAASVPDPTQTYERVVGLIERGEADHSLLEEYVERNPADVQAGEALGDLWDSLGDDERALRAYERVLARQPAAEKPLLKALELIKARKEFLRGLALVEAAGAAPPAAALPARAELLLLAGRAAECRQACEAALAGDPSRPDLLRLLGEALESEGSVAEAIAAFERVTRLAPSDSESKRRLASLKKRLAGA